MHIALLTYGSRGDFQPFLALALGLQKAGHTVRLAAPGRFVEMAAARGVPFAALTGDPVEVSRGFNDAGGNIYRMVKSMRDHVFAIAPQVIREARAACAGADLVIHSFLFTTGGHALAREMDIPDLSVQTFPIFAPTRRFPNVTFPGSLPGWMNRLTHWLATQIYWHGGNSGYSRLRRAFPQDFPKKLHWPFKQMDDRPLTPLVFAYSPTVLPRPDDWTAPHIHVPGWFFLDEPDYAPPPALADFLAAGGPPACVSFGSMVHRDAERIGRAVLEALERSGLRGILLTGWGGWTPERLPENAFAIESAPHAWLFPRCSAVVHHGGAGTTAAGLRAGVPNVVVPFAADQPFWAGRVSALGAGPRPIPVRKLTAESLAAALRQAVNDESICRRAADAGEKIRAEDGVGETVRLAEGWAETFRGRKG